VTRDPAARAPAADAPAARARSPLATEAARKAIHVSSAVIPLAYAAGLPRAALLAAFAGLGVVAAAVEVARRRSARFRAWFLRAVGGLLRAHEHASVSGASWMLAAYALSAVLFPRDVAVAAMLAVALGDAAAAIVGRWAGARRDARARAAGRDAPGGKTLAGSAACAVATFVGALAVARLDAGAAAAAAIAAAIAERPTWRLDDNVRVALAAGAAALAWRALLGR
jgi:dolichol kinase